MSDASSNPSLKRRWDRFVLRMHGRLDGDRADRIIPWISAAIVFATHLALDAAALRSLDGGSGVGPWLQASWRRRNGGAGSAVAGVDPAAGSWSFISEPILWLTRFVPSEAIFAVVQAAAISLAVIPLWRLARNEARLRVGAAMVVLVAFALAPTLHRANLTPFHPELIALPALLWAYVQAYREQWWKFSILILVVLACRADLGLTVAALGLLLVIQGWRLPGLITAGTGLAWITTAALVLDPSAPTNALTPAGEFVARATTPLAVFPRLVLHPWAELSELFAEPSVLFLVVVLAPLLFLPLVSLRKLIVAFPCLILAMIADRAVQRVAQDVVLSLSPAAAHIAPAMAFVFVALVFALERVGTTSVTRVNVDRRVLMALLAGATLFFVTEAPTSPYRQPWEWGGRDMIDGARVIAADQIEPADRVAASPSTIALVAERAHLVALPADPVDFTPGRVRGVADRVDAILLDTSPIDPRTGDLQWSAEDVSRVLGQFGSAGFAIDQDAQGVYLLTTGPDVGS